MSCRRYQLKFIPTKYVPIIAFWSVWRFVLIAMMSVMVASRSSSSRTYLPCFLTHPRSSHKWWIHSNHFDDLLNEVLCKDGNSAQLDDTEPRDDENEPNGGGSWRSIDWNLETNHHLLPMTPSPVDTVMIRDRLVYIKRDDQLRLPGSQISGNKARKMLSLHCLDSSRFPSCIVSYGGPQSNAMLAIAAVVHYHNSRLVPLSRNDTETGAVRKENIESTPPRKRFVYYTKKLPRFLRNQPSGNLFRALSLGMELIELSPDEYNRLFGDGTKGAAPPLPPPVPGDSVWIPQGGACAMAIPGTERLAREIFDFWAASPAPLSVCIPGGTCSTALLVHRALRRMVWQASSANGTTPPPDIQVVVIPCVGDEAYARRQMRQLQQQLSGGALDDDSLPTILPPFPVVGRNDRDDAIGSQPPMMDYFRFGEPNVHLLQTFRELRDEYDVVVDLLYGAPSWSLLFRHWKSGGSSGVSTEFQPDAPLSGRRILYVHSGGLEGINSQLLRYKYQNLVDENEIQLPGRSSS